jgi:hypothetical protein
MNSILSHEQIATSWAASALAAKGCKLFAVSGGAWDIELPDGSWRAANDWRELCVVARSV